MYVLKQTPQDFIVNEVSTIIPKEEGKWSYCLLKKTNLNTLTAIDMVARQLHLPLKYVGFAGNKDKIAVTQQVISLKERSKEEIERVSINGLELTFLGKGDVPICLGDLKGNEFSIVIRNVEKLYEKTKFLNLFGEQRFGGNNVEVGRAILKKDFRMVCDLLSLDKGNPVESLKEVKSRLARLYVHAFQSLIWNKTALQLQEENLEVESIPLPGFDFSCDNARVEELIKQFLKEEGISFRDFIIRQIPELSGEGGSRKMFEEASDLLIEKIEDGFRVKFFLPRGCYATVFLEQLTRP